VTTTSSQKRQARGTRRVRRIRALVITLPGIAAVTALGLPASAARAADTAGRGQYVPSASEWWLTDWQVPQKVWPLTQGAGVTVAVVDTGVQASVPDLKGVVVPGGDMLGDPGNGETDFDTQVDGHGTAVAVLIAGQGTGTGTVGIAPQARILPVHVDTPGVAGDTDDMAAGIEFAASHGASVINISLGVAAPSATSCDSDLQDAVAYAIGRGAVVVAAAGDTNISGSGPVEPAACAGVLAVGGTEPDGALWPGSVQQPYVSVAAPADPVDYVGRDGRYSTDGAGTSASAPLVAGLAALIRSRYPSMPWYQVDQRIIATASLEGSQVPGTAYGYGIVDPAEALSPAAAEEAVPGQDPVLDRFQAWLASPAGQAWQQAASAPAAAAAPDVAAGPMASARSASRAAATGVPEKMTIAPPPAAADSQAAEEPVSSPHLSRAVLVALSALVALGAGNLIVLALLSLRRRRYEPDS
jgi:membrane-anchored mycosin MYCP